MSPKEGDDVFTRETCAPQPSQTAQLNQVWLREGTWMRTICACEHTHMYDIHRWVLLLIPWDIQSGGMKIEAKQYRYNGRCHCGMVENKNLPRKGRRGVTDSLAYSTDAWVHQLIIRAVLLFDVLCNIVRGRTQVRREAAHRSSSSGFATTQVARLGGIFCATQVVAHDASTTVVIPMPSWATVFSHQLKLPEDDWVPQPLEFLARTREYASTPVNPIKHQRMASVKMSGTCLIISSSYQAPRTWCSSLDSSKCELYIGLRECKVREHRGTHWC